MTVTFAECDIDPVVPVTVTKYVPGVGSGGMEGVRMVWLVPFGSSVRIIVLPRNPPSSGFTTPCGKTVATRATGPVKLLKLVNVITEPGRRVPVRLGRLGMLSRVGLAEMVKPGTPPVIVIGMLTELDTSPPVPVTVAV